MQPLAKDLYDPTLFAYGCSISIKFTRDCYGATGAALKQNFATNLAHRGGLDHALHIDHLAHHVGGGLGGNEHAAPFSR